MKSTYLKLFSILTCLLLMLVSCSKSDDDNKTSIVATWKISEFGEDNNENNVIDAGETTTVEAAGAHGMLTLKGDNTYNSELFDGANPYSESGT